MADFLLELFSEEIPARMQVAAIEHLQTALQKGLGVVASKIFSTPRRLAVIIKDLPATQPDITTELKGPKIDAPEAAINGFLKKNNLTLEQLENRDGIYFATTHQKGKATAEVLKSLIEEVLANFPWPKSMRWGSGATAWVRPLHGILCIFDGVIVPVQFAGITAGNTTYGHRFLAPNAITITSPAEYENKLEKAFVIADRNKRKTEVLVQAEAVVAAKNLTIKKDDALLEEVVGLVEYPQMLVGKIDDKFMDLPPEVLTMVMRSHQKYFALQNANGTLSSNFLITSNMKTDDDGKAIIAGNERVLRARFADARFFWDTDRKKPLSEWAEGLKTVTYHAKLGTVADKVERVKTLAASLAEYVPNADKNLVIRAAELCKADLVTGMVGEFAELQGIMGRYYAIQQGENPAVADAIMEHYKPVGAGDSVPTAPVSICVALADKLDTLISMFAINEKPTGSKDPFALRRAALGVIRIILENGVKVSLSRILETNILDRYWGQIETVYSLISTNRDNGTFNVVTGKLTISFDLPKVDEEQKTLRKSFLDFFHDRLKVMLKEQGLRHDVINAVITDTDDDLLLIVSKAKALQEFLQTPESAKLLASYKRSANIVSAEEKKDKISYNDAKPTISNLEEQIEKDLLSLLEKLEPEINTLIKQEKYSEAMSKLAELHSPLEQFFDKIMVNSENQNLRVERLRLLSYIQKTINSIANFAVLEG